jgi:hypothetical protein
MYQGASLSAKISRDFRRNFRPNEFKVDEIVATRLSLKTRRCSKGGFLDNTKAQKKPTPLGLRGVGMILGHSQADGSAVLT